MSLKDIFATNARRLLERWGYTLAGSWHLREIVLARHLRWLFETFSVDCVFDVGANEGQYARFLRREVGYRGQILSFEPISELARKLESLAAADQGWKVHQLALGDLAGHAEINVMNRTDFSSFLQPSTEMTAIFSDTNKVTRRETVPVAVLAKLVPELGREYRFCRPYLKVDTQGHDLAVFRGAAEELNSFVATQTELSFRPIYEGAPMWREVLAFLETKGFIISDLFSICHDERIRAVEFDCVLVNSSFLDGCA